MTILLDVSTDEKFEEFKKLYEEELEKEKEEFNIIKLVKEFNNEHTN